jgi:hypothetical protein
MQLWSKVLHETCDDPAFSAAIGVPRASLKETATEMIASARRRGLEERVRDAIDAATHVEATDKAASKATIVAERLINRFVITFGVAEAPRAIAFDASGLGAKPADYQEQFILGWVKTFYEQAIANAQTTDGLIHDIEQNQRLGDILKQLAAEV